jgi:hypothetical protein
MRGRQSCRKKEFGTARRGAFAAKKSSGLCLWDIPAAKKRLLGRLFGIDLAAQRFKIGRESAAASAKERSESLS